MTVSPFIHSLHDHNRKIGTETQCSVNDAENDRNCIDWDSLEQHLREKSFVCVPKTNERRQPGESRTDIFITIGQLHIGG